MNRNQSKSILPVHQPREVDLGRNASGKLPWAFFGLGANCALADVEVDVCVAFSASFGGDDICMLAGSVDRCSSTIALID